MARNRSTWGKRGSVVHEEIDLEDDLEVELEDVTKSRLAMSPLVPPPPTIKAPSSLALKELRDKGMMDAFDFSSTNLTPLQQVYIMSFALRGTRSHACRMADVSHKQVRTWMEDEEFALELQGAVDMVADTLEGELIRRAMDGSDRLLIKAVEAHIPERYSPRHNISQNIVHSWADLAKQAAEPMPLAIITEEEEEEETYE